MAVERFDDVDCHDLLQSPGARHRAALPSKSAPNIPAPGPLSPHNKVLQAWLQDDLERLWDILDNWGYFERAGLILQLIERNTDTLEGT